MPDIDDIFSDLMKEVKQNEKAKAVLKRKDASPSEIAEANRIRQEWIDADWTERAAGPMFARHVCSNCHSQQSMFMGWFVESTHNTKRDTQRLFRVQELDQDQMKLQRVRFFREQETEYCAMPGCIDGYDSAPWKR
jgi:hypothetical protein